VIGVPDIQLDNPDEICWFYGRGPAPVLGPCPHDCRRHTHRNPHAHSLIAWGPTTDRYKLVECNGDTECAGRCRAWLDGWGNVVTDWLMVDVDPAAVAWSTLHSPRALALGEQNMARMASRRRTGDLSHPGPPAGEVR
jgi:hypothetical protein